MLLVLSLEIFALGRSTLADTKFDTEKVTQSPTMAHSSHGDAIDFWHKDLRHPQVRTVTPMNRTLSLTRCARVAPSLSTYMCARWIVKSTLKPIRMTYVRMITPPRPEARLSPAYSASGSAAHASSWAAGQWGAGADERGEGRGESHGGDGFSNTQVPAEVHLAHACAQPHTCALVMRIAQSNATRTKGTHSRGQCPPCARRDSHGGCS